MFSNAPEQLVGPIKGSPVTEVAVVATRRVEKRSVAFDKRVCSCQAAALAVSRMALPDDTHTWGRKASGVKNG